MKNSKRIRALLLALCVVVATPLGIFAAEDVNSNDTLILVAKHNNKKIVCKWNKIDNATKYVVYGGLKKGKLKKISSTNGNKLVVSNKLKLKKNKNKAYAVKVKAYCDGELISESNKSYFVPNIKRDKYIKSNNKNETKLEAIISETAEAKEEDKTDSSTPVNPDTITKTGEDIKIDTQTPIENTVLVIKYTYNGKKVQSKVYFISVGDTQVKGFTEEVPEGPYFMIPQYKYDTHYASIMGYKDDFGTKLFDEYGRFASNNITGYIKNGKWIMQGGNITITAELDWACELGPAPREEILRRE